MRRTKYYRASTILAIAITFTLLLSGCALWQKISTPSIPVASSKDLASTMVAPTMEFGMDQHKNMLYCVTFQLAWNELKNKIIHDNIALDKPSQVVNSLNKELSTNADLSPDSYLSMVGFGKDDIEGQINRALQEKFGGQAPVVKENLMPDDILAYAYLYKNLQFVHEFEQLVEPISFTSGGGKKEKVKGFGIKKYTNDEAHYNLGSQVAVVDYRSNSDFIVQLDAKSKDDQIILAKVQPQQTLLATVNYVQERIAKGHKVDMLAGDTLQIPDINFDIQHSYTELQNRGLKNNGFQDYYIRKAIQNTRFVLDEKGAVLKSEAKIIMQKSVHMPTTHGTLNLVYDKPFLVLIKDKQGNLPYFALWIDNTELLKGGY